MARRPQMRMTRSQRVNTWLSIDLSITNFTAVGGTILNLMTALELAKRPFTVIRTHWTVQLTSDQQIATETQLGAVGLAIVSDQAVDVGITAIPTPVTDLDSDLWFVHQVLMNDFTFAGAVAYEASAGRVWEIDSKAMRKVNDDQQIVIVGESSAAGDGFILSAMGRLLIKEH